ncbi:MAG: ATP-binding protein [Deferribacteraceae bacterium]|nr:ATP-binding protein [Deferribacteraceae bacterium]
MFERTLKNTIEQVSATFPVLLVTGPRQVGKTTLLEDCGINRNYVSLDDLEAKNLAINDPALFLQTYKPPLTIDEVQYAPQLFPYIKIAVDKSKKMGEFWLTGSQKFHLMKGITESLAGRIAILDLLGFSEKEKEQKASRQTPFTPTFEWVEAAQASASNFDIDELYQRIWQGSFPAVVTRDGLSREIFYKAYLQTYIERDVRELVNVTKGLSFYNFIRAAAARTAQLVNYAALAKDAGIDQKTAKAWLSVLETSGIIKLLEPYHSNITKRLIKTPKLYFLDTGLVAFLTGWDSPKSLSAGAMNGAMLETHVFIEILKGYWHNGQFPNIYFYRDADQREIDFLIERNMTLYPIEVKRSASPKGTSFKSFAQLAKLDKAVGSGAVLCLRNGHLPISQDVIAMNIGYL